MKKQDITYQDKLNELRLDINHPNNKGIVYIFVEGQSDIKLFRKFFDLEKCKVESIPGGKYKLEECVDELVKTYFLIIGIRDSDFIHLDKIKYSKLNMFLTDMHDIEMTLISEEEIFSALLFEFTEAWKKDHLTIRNNIIKSIEQISLLKWLNEIENLEINFEPGFQDLISFVTNEVDFKEYFKRLISKSPNIKINDINVIETKIGALKKSNPNPLFLCNGHDFMRAFSQYLKDKEKIKGVNDDMLCTNIRMAFRNDLLKKTALYSNTKNWADNNNCVIYS